MSMEIYSLKALSPTACMYVNSIKKSTVVVKLAACYQLPSHNRNLNLFWKDA